MGPPSPGNGESRIPPSRGGSPPCPPPGPRFLPAQLPVVKLRFTSGPKCRRSRAQGQPLWSLIRGCRYAENVAANYSCGQREGTGWAAEGDCPRGQGSRGMFWHRRGPDRRTRGSGADSGSAGVSQVPGPAASGSVDVGYFPAPAEVLWEMPESCCSLRQHPRPLCTPSLPCNPRFCCKSHPRPPALSWPRACRGATGSSGPG